MGLISLMGPISPISPTVGRRSSLEQTSPAFQAPSPNLGEGKGPKGRKGIQNAKFKIASKREQRVLAHYAEREQLKDTNGGLKFKIIY